MKKILYLFVVGILILGGLGAVAITDDTTYDVIKLEEESIVISEPTIKDTGQYIMLNLNEETSFILEVGKPMLPIVTRVFTFPFGTKISHVDVSYSEVNTLMLSKEVQPVPEPIPMNAGLQLMAEPLKDKTVYESTDLYPTNSYSYITGSGLENGKHVVYLAVKCYFTRYSPAQNIIYYSKNADIEITYEEPVNPMIFDDIYDMVIISPSEYSDELQPLMNHKNSYEVKTIIKTTETIYTEYQGVDETEKIKYFIKDAIENWGITNVLLVGSIDKLPIRTTYAGFWGENDVLTDLYYADIYNDTGGFCSWDGNNNGIFGEVKHEHHQTYDIDSLDLFPDVNIGRLACVDENEVNIIVDKIIHYETDTYGKNWFNNIVLCGGDTFPSHNGNEGEMINNIVEGKMSDFTPIKLWTSDDTFNARNLNNAVNNGAGFVDYSGHGYVDRMGTHPPNDESWKMYFNINLLGLLNGYKLPIVYFDACLTSKLDYDTSETSIYNSRSTDRFSNSFLIDLILKPISKILNLFLDNYKSKVISGVLNSKDIITEPKADNELISCFSWNWMKMKNRGAIATIGATRTAYGGINDGAGKIAIEFFSAYENSENLGQMMTESQNEYIIDVPGDLFTVEEFLLLGDPSLKVGGYP